MKLLWLVIFLVYHANAEDATPPVSIVVAPDVTTTTPPNTITTTPPNTTTTVPPTSSTPMPVPDKPQSPQIFNYTLSDSKDANKTCIMAKFAAQFAVTYNNTAKIEETAYINLGNTSEVDTTSSTCWDPAKNESYLVIKINGTKNILKFTIKKNEKDRYVDKIEVKYNVTEKEFPLFPKDVPQIIAVAENQTLFKSDLKKSYLCDSKEEITLVNNENIKVVLTLTNVQFDALRNVTGHDFQEAQVCPADDQVNDIVPIAVGIALAVLVVIVLIAYFIGRRRSRRLAYQSV